ncbi:Actin regulatory protein CAP-G [Intoshia linei]|uniref:Actin regulatory protein CAP-G n=1 Tax=Intoshia linei TaxID=1819745 RepID=A0A177BEA1_9BILA|nr:Actin regulatory protein CAP-G [Intoshia linei]
MKFKVEKVALNDYGSFYNGDSYIILNAFKNESDRIEYDVHFWIGKYSTQDEYGTAAYKTVELDNYLDDVPIQHREVQNHESSLFLSYFKSLTIMRGGTDSGFRHVGAKEYIPRLLHFSGLHKNILVKEIPKNYKLIKHDDVYIFDKGKEIIQWNGTDCNKDEKFKALRFIGEIKMERNASSKVIDDNPHENKEFFSMLTENDEDEIDHKINIDEKSNVLYRISDASGNIVVEKVKEGVTITKDNIDDMDVFILDKASSLYVIKGKNASNMEKKMGLAHAHNFLKDSQNPYKSITVFDMKMHQNRINAVLSG